MSGLPFASASMSSARAVGAVEEVTMCTGAAFDVQEVVCLLKDGELIGPLAM